jgi:AcrR family transcriptional regulator
MNRMSETRDKILEAALDCFIERSYDKVTLREIADKVGVTKAALYYHFTSKEQILVTLLEPLMSMQDELMDRLGQTPTPESWAKGLAGFVVWALAQRRLFELAQSNRTMLRELMERSEHLIHHEEMHQRIDSVLSDESIPLEDRVRMAGATGFVIGVLAGPAGSPFPSVPVDELGALIIEGVNDVLRVSK